MIPYAKDITITQITAILIAFFPSPGSVSANTLLAYKYPAYTIIKAPINSPICPKNLIRYVM